MLKRITGVISVDILKKKDRPSFFYFVINVCEYCFLFFDRAFTNLDKS